MKYIPLNFSPNVSGSGTATSPSLKMDDRGFPHIAWLDRKAEQNRVNYAFWDGSKWSYKDIPEVHISNSDVIYAPNSLVLDNDYNPYVIFSNKTDTGTILSLANYDEEWNFVNLVVDYEVGWVGIGRYNREGIYSSSSSYSSTIDLGSSSSSSLSSSSSSSSSGSSSSSSHSLESCSSNSSSTDSFTSSSSSSYDDSIFFATVYDITNSMFRIYSVSQVWRLLGFKYALVESYSSIRSDMCGRRIGIAYISGRESSSSSSSNSFNSSESSSSSDKPIEYDMFDLYDNTWSFASFKTLVASQSYGPVIEMDMAGYSQENVNVMLFGWLSKTNKNSYIHSVLAFPDGTEIPSDYISQIVESSSVNVTTDSEYMVNSYQKIAVCVNGYLPNIFVGGISFKAFNIVETYPLTRTWQKNLTNVDCISNGVVIEFLRASFYSGANIAFAADSGDIYYLEPNVSMSRFDVSTPGIIALDGSEAFNGVFSGGAIHGTNISGIKHNFIGRILKDSQRPLIITSNRTSNEVIVSGDIEKNTVIGDRDILSSDLINSIDIDQIRGNILVTKPDDDSVVIYSQNEMPVTIQRFNIIGSLFNPLDAKFDFIRDRIWIADMGNNRIVGLDTDINLVDAQVDISSIVYPHVICADLNSGGVFVKGYVDSSMAQGIVYHFDAGGSEMSNFVFDIQTVSLSSSSSSESAVYPGLPSTNTMSYDNVRNKIWWIDGSKIYVADESNKEVQVHNIKDEGFYEAISIDVELATGNAFVVIKDLHNCYLVQMSKDNKEIIAEGHII